MAKAITPEQLVEDNIRLAYYAAQLYRNALMPFEDCLSAAMEGLWRAARTFNPEHRVKGKPVRFSVYAVTCIRNQIFLDYRARKKAQRCIPMSDVLEQAAMPGGASFERSDDCGRVRSKHTGMSRSLVSWADGFEEDLLDWIDVKKGMENLTANQRRTLILTMIYGYSCSDLSRRFGRVRSLFQREKTRAIQKLTAHLASRA